MKHWTGRTADDVFGLLIEEGALLEIDRMCDEAVGFETGGILVGRYSENLTVAVVREATPPPVDSHRGPSWFHRGVAGLRATLARRWHSKKRTYYLGEWHYHPVATVFPSGDDFSQMAQIAGASEYECKEPLLVIFGAKEGDGDRPLRAFVSPEGSDPMEVLPADPDAPWTI